MILGRRSKACHLFSEMDIHDLLDNAIRGVTREVEGIDGNRLLNTSPEDLCNYLITKFTLDSPRILEDKIIADQSEVNLDVSQDFNRYVTDRSRPFVKLGTQVTLEVPFEGDAGFFRVRPTTFTTAPPIAEVRACSLLLSTSGTELKPDQVRSEFDRTLNEIKKYLEWLVRDVNQFNDQLPTQAQQSIERRREKLLADRNLVASIGFPLRKRDDEISTYSAPKVRRKILPKLPSAATAPFQPEPALSKENYEHILNVLWHMVLVMERSPRAFRNMNEETIRDHFLVQLNGQYEGNATGETFNGAGKTDILIRINGRNIFIAECKFWHGPRKLLEAIDQLLTYASWRDTKTAILLFNRNKEFSKVLEVIPKIIADHRSYKRRHECALESGFMFTFGQPDDPNRELQLTALAFDVPN